MNQLILLDAASTQSTGGVGSILLMLVPYALIIVALYFIMIRPQSKKRKKEDAMRKGAQIGDEITTIGGIMGRVVTFKEDSLIIETGADRNKMKITRWAVQTNNTANERAQAEREAAKAQAEKDRAEGKKKGWGRKKDKAEIKDISDAKAAKKEAVDETKPEVVDETKESKKED